MVHYCPSCGYEYNFNDNFCPRCGITLNRTEAKLTTHRITNGLLRCNYCGSVIEKDDQKGICFNCKKPICKYCGYAVAKSWFHSRC